MDREVKSSDLGKVCEELRTRSYPVKFCERSIGSDSVRFHFEELEPSEEELDEIIKSVSISDHVLITSQTGRVWKLIIDDSGLKPIVKIEEKMETVK